MLVFGGVYVCTRIVQTHIELKAIVVHFPWLRSSMGWLGSGALGVHVAWGLLLEMFMPCSKYGSYVLDIYTDIVL